MDGAIREAPRPARWAYATKHRFFTQAEGAEKVFKQTAAPAPAGADVGRAT